MSCKHKDYCAWYSYWCEADLPTCPSFEKDDESKKYPGKVNAKVSYSTKKAVIKTC